VKLTIITISKNFSFDLIKTLKSVNNQSIEPFQHIVVVSGISDDNIIYLSTNHSISYRYFIYNKDSSIYNGMNLAFNITYGNYLYFLNSGDIFYNNDCIKLIKNKFLQYPNTIFLFQTLQVYNDLSFLRYPLNYLYKLKMYPSHQGFIVPFNSHNISFYLFNENNYISADSEWMKKLLLLYDSITFDNIISIFYLGGISNFPTIKTIKLKYKTNMFYLEIIKYIFRKIVGLRNYYRIIFLINGCEKV